MYLPPYILITLSLSPARCSACDTLTIELIVIPEYKVDYKVAVIFITGLARFLYHE